jgi:hypothetical protein
MPASRRVRLLVLAVTLPILSTPGLAQSPARLEAGAQFSALRNSDADITDYGFGGRIGWQASRWLDLEAAADVFPSGKDDVVRGGRKLHVLAGPRAGWRSARIGLFAKSRVGVARIGEGRPDDGPCILIFPPPGSCYDADTRLAFDLGGVVEAYLSPRATLRLDIGDLMTRLGDSSSRFNGTSSPTHDLLVSVGAGWRF